MSNFLIVLHSQLLMGNVAERQPQCDRRTLMETKKCYLGLCFPQNIPHDFTCMPATKSHTYMTFMLRLTTFTPP